ncbi:dienelactone hydrolase family protein [Helcobacillus massiliensis]|uniref:S-formylglutathione hydrolase FrmB n=1 Tax=Helcobacillus massiliensis TaxID=521392 RepID=A0A839QVI4_9MICO|nr:S-formylglutathione hydrolase FrmB [Helcobacillus massiliensis]
MTRSSLLTTITSRTAAVLAAGALAFSGAALTPTAANAAEHGDAPTQESITKDGPYEVTSTKLKAGEFSGFGGGTLFYPANPKDGEKYGLVVAMPGFLEPGSVNEVTAKRLASHGFIVLQANTYTGFEQPQQRATMAVRAMESGLKHPAIQKIVDKDRTALIGHSMGGGGVLYAAQAREFDAVIAVHPWAQTGFPRVNEPTLVVGGMLDNVAPYAQYTLPIYGSLTGAKDRYLINHLTGTHWAGNVDDPALQGRMLSFMKVHVDGDERYAELLCQDALPSTTFRSPSC